MGSVNAGGVTTNLRDDRLLPFEGAGVESTWTLELPKEFRQFDYSTISDVVVHLRYQARDGGAQLRSAALDHLAELASDNDTTGWGLLLGLRTDFPAEWVAFTSGSKDFTGALRRDHFPYHTGGRSITIAGIDLYRVAGTSAPKHHLVGDPAMLTALSTALNDDGECTLTLPPDPAGPNQVLPRAAAADVWDIIRYSLG